MFLHWVICWCDLYFPAMSFILLLSFFVSSVLHCLSMSLFLLHHSPFHCTFIFLLFPSCLFSHFCSSFPSLTHDFSFLDFIFIIAVLPSTCFFVIFLVTRSHFSFFLPHLLCFLSRFLLQLSYCSHDALWHRHCRQDCTFNASYLRMKNTPLWLLGIAFVRVLCGSQRSPCLAASVFCVAIGHNCQRQNKRARESPSWEAVIRNVSERAGGKTGKWREEAEEENQAGTKEEGMSWLII